MVPLSGTGLSGISRVLDVNVAPMHRRCCTAWAQWLVEYDDVCVHISGLGSNLKNPSTSRHAYLPPLQQYLFAFGLGEACEHQVGRQKPYHVTRPGTPL